MLLRNENTTENDYEENWPLHYYDISDISMRERTLRSIIEKTEQRISSLSDKDSSEAPSRNEETSSPESLRKVLSDNNRRLEILIKRYPYNKSGSERHDAFLAAWMNILITGRIGINFLNRNRVKKELTGYLRDLCILDFTKDDILISEWEDFSKLWITSCIKDKNYDSTIFGLIRLSDKNLARKIAFDIIEVTYSIPLKFGYEKQCEGLRNILKDSYFRLIEDGEKFWTDCFGNRF